MYLQVQSQFLSSAKKRVSLIKQCRGKYLSEFIRVLRQQIESPCQQHSCGVYGCRCCGRVSVSVGPLWGRGAGGRRIGRSPRPAMKKLRMISRMYSSVKGSSVSGLSTDMKRDNKSFLEAWSPAAFLSLMILSMNSCSTFISSSNLGSFKNCKNK